MVRLSARLSGWVGFWPAAYLAVARSLICAVVASMAALAADPATAEVQASDIRRVTLGEIDAQWPKLTPAQQFGIIDQLLKSARLDVAENLLAHTRLANDSDRRAQRFYVGLLRKSQGRLPEAVDIFRGILAAHPDLARVRLELAHTLFLIKEDDSARHHFELLLGAAGSSPGLEQTARAYINAIDGRKRWSFSTFLSIAPSTNLNQGSSNPTVMLNGLPFTLSEDDVKKSGVGLVGGAQAGYRQPLNDRLDLIATVGAQGKLYREGDFNDALLSASLGPKYNFDWGYVGLYGLADKRWVANEDYATSWGGMFSVGVQMSTSDLLFADVVCRDRQFDTDWQDSDMSYQDGAGCSVSGRVDHHLDSQTFLRGLGAVGREHAGVAHLDNDYWMGGAGVYREVAWGLSIYLEATYTDLQYEGVYPGITEAREDNRIDVRANFTKRDLELLGYAPMLQLTYTTNASNVPFAEFDAQGLNFTLTKQY
jgi:tetratricopeptide (TPR) repeat protein